MIPAQHTTGRSIPMSEQPNRGFAWRMIQIIGVVCVCLLALICARVALADIAPPEQPPGSNISPGGQTQVWMRAEEVVIDVRPRAGGGDRNGVVLAGDLAEAQVRGAFHMHNL